MQVCNGFSRSYILKCLLMVPLVFSGVAGFLGERILFFISFLGKYPGIVQGSLPLLDMANHVNQHLCC